MKILFVTGNQRKMRDARAACEPFGITVEQLKPHIDEIQHHDPLEISRHKAAQAFALAKQPVVINDASWNIPALNGFPGGYMKDVAEWFTPQNFIDLLNGQDAKICCIETVIYIDGTQEKVFQEEYWGRIADQPKGTGNSIEQVAMFGDKTIGEYHQVGELAIDPKECIWHGFVHWYSEYAKPDITQS